VTRAIDLARQYRVGDLRRTLLAEARRLGPREFLHRRAGPLVAACGREWADGNLTIRHEHLLTAALEDVLRSLRTQMPARGTGPLVLLVTLPGETHGLGLLMAALAAALCGARPRLLGTSLPLPEIAAAARESGAGIVAVSVSLATGGVDTDRLLRDLRAALPESVRLVAGGAGARRRRGGPRGVEFLHDLEAFEALLAGAA
jgi:methanogenic corrinoid protein MtbC1